MGDSREACESGHARRLEQSHGESDGCFAWNGAICEWVHGTDPSQCYTSDAQCEQAHGGSGCFNWNGAICEWVNGADPSQCYDSREACESGHTRRLEQSHGESDGCFAWNGAICEWVHGA